MSCTPSLLLFQGPLWSGGIVPISVTSICQMELFNHVLYLKPFNSVQTNDLYLIDFLV